MGGQLSREEEEVRAAFRTSLAPLLDQAFATAARSSGRDWSDLEREARALVTFEALQHATIGSLVPSVGEMVASALGGSASLAYDELDGAQLTLLTEFDTTWPPTPFFSDGEEFVDEMAAVEQLVELLSPAWGDALHARAFVLELADCYEAARARAAAAHSHGGGGGGGCCGGSPLAPLSALTYRFRRESTIHQDHAGNQARGHGDHAHCDHAHPHGAVEEGVPETKAAF